MYTITDNKKGGCRLVHRNRPLPPTPNKEASYLAPRNADRTYESIGNSTVHRTISPVERPPTSPRQLYEIRFLPLATSTPLSRLPDLYATPPLVRAPRAPASDKEEKEEEEEYEVSRRAPLDIDEDDVRPVGEEQVLRREASISLNKKCSSSWRFRRMDAFRRKPKPSICDRTIRKEPAVSFLDGDHQHKQLKTSSLHFLRSNATSQPKIPQEMPPPPPIEDVVVLL